MKISVITVCKNAQGTIEDTIKSVLSQTYGNVEYIIVDGQSNDNTLQIIDKYKDKISKVISEPDNSLYEAMNKGLVASTGDIIYYLNADDVFYDNNVLENVVKCFKSSNKPVLCFNILIKNPETGNEYYKTYPNIDKLFLFKDCICQQALFYRKEIFSKVGFFDEGFKIAGDYDWLLRAYLWHDVRIDYFDLPVANFREIGIYSSGEKARNTYFKEVKDLTTFYFGNIKPSLYRLIFRYFGSLTKVKPVRGILVRLL